MMDINITEVPGRKPSDIISNLPADVLNAILMCVPLRDAVRTSILSRKWRYNWAKLPNITLDQTLWNGTKRNISVPRIKFAVILYQLLSLHQGPITTCRISIPDLKDCPEVDNLMFFLSRNGVEHLLLELPMGEKYKLPSSVFTCSQMRHLTLHYCLINPPPTFKAFSRLLQMCLFNVCISDKSLEKLISCCPLLEKLMLDISDPLDHIDVNAPELRHFTFGSKINSICFKDMALLAEVSIVMQHAIDHRSSVQRGKCNLVKFFGSLPAVKDLRLDYFIIKTLISGTDEIPVRLPNLLLCLRQLYLVDVSLSGLDEVCCILCLIRSSPYLEAIEIEAFNDQGDAIPAQEFWEAQYYLDIKLNQLKKVKLKEITGKRPEMELIKLLLAKSPMLEKMLIEPCTKHISTQTLINIMKQVTRFGRASPRAEVIF